MMPAKVSYRNSDTMRIKALFLLLSIAFNASLSLAQEGGIESLRQFAKAFASVGRQVSPSVVYIEVESTSPVSTMRQLPTPFGDDWPFSDDFFRRFFGEEFPGFPRGDEPRSERRAISQGSGFVFATEDKLFSDRAYILTNNHVVRNADSIRVTLQDGREFDAIIKGRDPRSDVAVIELRAGGLPALPLGSSSDLEVGEWVIAIGNPFGLRHSLTVGVVSAKGRSSLGINDYEDFIQTDAAINPGNSGGPLVNLDGEVIGINTAIFTRSGGYMGVGFAIPIDLAREIANQLIDSGEVTRGFLGIVIQQLTPELAESFDIEQRQGILISQVSDDSPAAKAGLQPGDVIVAFRGEPVTDIGHFRNRIALLPPDSREQLTIIRDGERQNISVTIGKLTEDEREPSGPTQSAAEIGLTVQTLTPQLAQRFGVEEQAGVIVTAVTRGSIAERAGIQTGSVISQVDRKPAGSAAEFNRAIDASIEDKRVLLLVRTGEVQQYIVLSW